ncbi:hypothetical protein A33I_17470 [Alkalihalophilus marmarensis DSM 21297]|jgi:hypothetical protein|uniref:Uncharacterized protein n=1 Tax=Alkalihalophilus marmarensis DSM 21297 TaxID=1188261 RepID=U6SLM7_9BACI|nr:hypothetical protein A33I_17470 [Alkalihalophilus marmarensis DSM 21297]
MDLTSDPLIEQDLNHLRSKIIICANSQTIKYDEEPIH